MVSAADHLAHAIAAHRASDLATAEARYRDGLADAGAGTLEQARLATGLGMLLATQSRTEAAVAAFAIAAEAAPERPQAHANLATALVKAGRLEPALASFDRALGFDRHLPGIALARAKALLALGRLAEAEIGLAEAAALDPAGTEALVVRGDALWALDRRDDAVACYRSAVERAPDHGLLLFGLGVALLALDRVDESIPVLAQAAGLLPSRADIHLAHARALHRAQRLAAALAAYDRVVALDPTHARAQFDRSLVLLALGDFARGWPAYEWRVRLLGSGAADATFTWPGRTGPPLSAWRGEDIAGRTILIQGEQGHGDILQFIRYVPMVAARGARVIVKVWPALVPLLAAHPEFGTVVGSHDGLPEIHSFSLMMSLPGVLGTSLDRIPADVPYIRADPAAVRRWADRLASLPPGRRVGLVWAGDPRPDDPDRAAPDRRHSTRLSVLAPLLAVPGVVPVSLQVGARAADARSLPILDISADLVDFAETAAAIANLDLVIAVDTAVVHLAGAMGKPVWLLSRFDGCWRWLDGRDDSPWYPTLRIYRQRRPDGWDEAVARAAADLQLWAMTT